MRTLPLAPAKNGVISPGNVDHFVWERTPLRSYPLPLHDFRRVPTTRRVVYGGERGRPVVGAQLPEGLATLSWVFIAIFIEKISSFLDSLNLDGLDPGISVFISQFF